MNKYSLLKNDSLEGFLVEQDISTCLKCLETAGLSTIAIEHRQIIESIEDGFCELDLNGYIIDFNKTLADMLGY